MSQNPKSKYDCDICGFTFERKDLIRSNGLLVDKACLDQDDPNSKVYWGFYGKEAHGAKTVTNITAANGVNSIIDIHMLIQGDGLAINILANPQIVAGSKDKQILNLEGYSDTYTVLIEDGNGVQLREGKSITLKKGTVIGFVYNSNTGLWVETSRSNFYEDKVRGSYI
jgi:hypothetical protein